MKNKIRADLLIKKQYPELQQSKIESLILRKQVYLDNELVLFSGQLLDTKQKIYIKKQKETVSRGSYKLKQAIDELGIDIENKICLDIGSSSGGFIYCLLEYKAFKVYGLDSGTNQLDYSLRTNKKVEVKENFSFNKLDTWNEIQNLIDIITIDISFNSIVNVFKKIKDIPWKKDIIIFGLIKPQFEKQLSENNNFNGLVENESERKEILNNTIKEIEDIGFNILFLSESNTKGKIKKNIEYLTWWEKK